MKTKTAEDWTAWFSEQFLKDPLKHCDPMKGMCMSLLTDTIRHAQDEAYQAGMKAGKEDGIEEAAQLIDDHRMGFGAEIRALINNKEMS